jgi:chromosomal replication initiation ATPase DnaA
MIKQKSFNYKFNSNNDEFDFFVNQTNFYAFNALINNKYKYSFLNGPKKSGKTYLSKIWLKKNNAIQYHNNYELLLDQKNNVLIDNLIFYDQEKIFYIVNNCILNNSKVLITSDNKINEINFEFKDLSSRLKTFSNLEINQPNDEMLFAILTKLLVERQFIIKSNEIFEYIIRRVDRTYQGINDIVKKLDILSLEKKRQLTIPLIKEIL